MSNINSGRIKPDPFSYQTQQVTEADRRNFEAAQRLRKELSLDASSLDHSAAQTNNNRSLNFAASDGRSLVMEDANATFDEDDQKDD